MCCRPRTYRHDGEHVTARSPAGSADRRPARRRVASRCPARRRGPGARRPRPPLAAAAGGHAAPALPRRATAAVARRRPGRGPVARRAAPRARHPARPGAHHTRRVGPPARPRRRGAAVVRRPARPRVDGHRLRATAPPAVVGGQAGRRLASRRSTQAPAARDPAPPAHAGRHSGRGAPGGARRPPWHRRAHRRRTARRASGRRAPRPGALLRQRHRRPGRRRPPPDRAPRPGRGPAHRSADHRHPARGPHRSPLTARPRPALAPAPSAGRAAPRHRCRDLGCGRRPGRAGAGPPARRGGGVARFHLLPLRRRPVPVQR